MVLNLNVGPFGRGGLLPTVPPVPHHPLGTCGPLGNRGKFNIECRDDY